MRYNLLMTTSFIFLISCQLESYQKNELRPNIIFILADDLGYGNLSCYGQTYFKTKNIDKLAKNGITFTKHYSGRTMAPSRAGLITGMHAHTETTIGNKRDKFGNWTLQSKNITIAEILKDNGYTTGVFGKWGLGYPGSDGDPNKQGFDEHFGYNDQTLAHSYYPLFLHRNQDTVWLEGNKGAGKEIYAPTLIHEQALKFIENNKNNTFFMYYPTIIPHAELCAPEIYMKKYRGKFLPEKEFYGADEGHPLFKKGGYASQPESHAAFAAMVNLLDDQVGEILHKIKELGIDKNTMVIFASDDGPHLEGGADPVYFNGNGPFKGFKRDLYEGGIRIPMLVCWPGKIKAGSYTDHISAMWDFLPTIVDILGVDSPDNLDGISYLPSLLGNKNQKQHDYLYWKLNIENGRYAVRQGIWKLIRYHNNSKIMTTELYNIEKDSAETINVAKDYPDITNNLLKILDQEEKKKFNLH